MFGGWSGFGDSFVWIGGSLLVEDIQEGFEQSQKWSIHCFRASGI